MCKNVCKVDFNILKTATEMLSLLYVLTDILILSHHKEWSFHYFDLLAVAGHRMKWHQAAVMCLEVLRLDCRWI